MMELFRLKIAAKRQITVPQRLLKALNLSEGDEIQVTVENGQIVSTQPCKSVPTTLIPDEMMAKVKTREKLLLEGKGIDIEEALENLKVLA